MVMLQIDPTLSLALGPDGLAILNAPDMALIAGTSALVRIQLANGFIETFIGHDLDQIDGVIHSYRIDVDADLGVPAYLTLTGLDISFAAMMVADDPVRAALWENDIVMGGNEADTIYAFDGHDLVYGGAGRDVINGQGGSDSLFGNQDQDFISGDIGDDVLAGGRDSDILYGNQGADMLYGNLDHDYLFGGGGGDILWGGYGDDVLFGGGGDDWLMGGIGNDWLVGGLGADTLIGGDGADIFDLGNLGLGEAGLDVLYDVTIEDQLLIPVAASISAVGDTVIISHQGYDVTLIGVDLDTVQAIAVLTSSAT